MNSVSEPDMFGFLEDLVDEADLEAILAKPPGQVRAELLAQGADLERVRMSLYRALGEEAPPAAKVSRAPATVTPITKARPDRVLTILRSLSVAVAASFFGLFVWREGTMRVAPDRPARPELSDSREAPPPSLLAETDAQKAAGLRTEAYRLCDQGYWGACEDKLDEAGRLDSVGNQTLEVNEARNRIGMGMYDDVDGVGRAYAKPGVGPGEVPLRRTPHR
jgi:hypothetical protein